MRLPFHIIQLLKEKLGKDLRLPSDCEFLALDIESKTGEHIGVNTMKRLLGFINIATVILLNGGRFLS